MQKELNVQGSASWNLKISRKHFAFVIDFLRFNGNVWGPSNLPNFKVKVSKFSA
jgi:hypothetical protein